MIPLADRGKLPDGQTTLPFEFPLRSSNPSYGLFETYHGVFVNVMYTITAEMQRGLFSKVAPSTTFSSSDMCVFMAKPLLLSHGYA